MLEFIICQRNKKIKIKFSKRFTRKETILHQNCLQLVTVCDFPRYVVEFVIKV